MATSQPSRNSRLFPLRPLYALLDLIPFTAVLSAGGFRTRHTSRPKINFELQPPERNKKVQDHPIRIDLFGLIMHRYDTLQCLAPLRILAEHSALMHAWPMGSNRTVHIRQCRAFEQASRDADYLNYFDENASARSSSKVFTFMFSFWIAGTLYSSSSQWSTSYVLSWHLHSADPDSRAVKYFKSSFWQLLAHAPFRGLRLGLS